MPTDRLIAFDSLTGDEITNATFAEQLRKPWTQFQEHRFDWIQGLTTFYEDNVPRLQMRKNVPTHVCSQPNSNFSAGAVLKKKIGWENDAERLG